MEAAASSYQAAEPRAGSAPKAWAYFDPESEPVDPSTQLIWPATRALVGDYLPPELRQPLPTMPGSLQGTPRRRHRPPPRAPEEVASQRRASLAAALLSRQLTGGAVARKAKQWESVVASHRNGTASARAAPAPPAMALTKPPGAAPRASSSRNRSRPGSARHRYVSKSIARPTTAPSASVAPWSRPDSAEPAEPAAADAGPQYGEPYEREWTEVNTAAALRTELLAMQDRFDELELRTEAEKGISRRARAIINAHGACERPQALHESPSPTPMSDTWRNRPLSARSCGAMTIESAPHFGAAAGGSSLSRSSRAVDEADESELAGLRDAAAAASARWAKEAVAMREEAADVSLGLPYAVRPPTADSMPSSAPWPTADTAAPTLPPPPEGIQFAWAHPQRLLAGLASAEFSWGPAEQRQFEEYVETALHLLSPEYELTAAERNAGVDYAMLCQLLQAPNTSELAAASEAELRPRLRPSPPQHPRPHSGRSLSSTHSPLSDDPSEPQPPPAWVDRLAVGGVERRQRGLAQTIRDLPEAEAEAVPPRASSSRSPSPQTAKHRVEDCDDNTCFAALSAQIMADIKQGHALSYERMTCLESLALTEEVAEGKVLSSQGMNTLHREPLCSFKHSISMPPSVLRFANWPAWFGRSR